LTVAAEPTIGATGAGTVVLSNTKTVAGAGVVVLAAVASIMIRD
jgi:hypothetical protein